MPLTSYHLAQCGNPEPKFTYFILHLLTGDLHSIAGRHECMDFYWVRAFFVALTRIFHLLAFKASSNLPIGTLTDMPAASSTQAAISKFRKIRYP
jgi:hypothetical protein